MVIASLAEQWAGDWGTVKPENMEVETDHNSCKTL
jgi:hypothetical protein